LRLPGSPGSLFFGMALFDKVPLLVWRGPMRKLILLSVLVLAGCGSNAALDNESVADEGSANEIRAANDATAIDAATGEAADMAADVNYTFNEEELNAVASNDSANSATSRNAQ